MSENNGNPRFNFRKMGYRDESQMSILALKIQHVSKQVDACSANGDIDILIEELEDLERKSLHLMVKLVSYLPDDYLIEGVDGLEIDYDDPEKILDVVNWGSMTQLGLDIAAAKYHDHIGEYLGINIT